MSHNKTPRFVTGSVWRHVLIMTLTNSAGIMALFMVDLIDLYFINLLGQSELAAAIGFSAQVLFFITAISIGFLIAIGILVAQRIGAKQVESAKQLVGSAFILASLLIIAITIPLYIYLEDIFIFLGATGETLKYSLLYSHILLPSSVILIIGMIASAIQRAVGDAKRSMYATLIAALVNLVLDPLLIFAFNMGLAGAAWASFIARIAMTIYALYCTIIVHKMLAKPSFKQMLADLSPISKIAVPAVMTNLATPVGSTFVMAAIARYGDAAVAAFATIGRIIPVAFSTLFALSGAISPIISQNYGAKEFDRVRATYRDALIFTIATVLTVSMIILVSRHYIVDIFNLTGDARELLVLFCSGLTFFFIADGLIFSTNSAFNSLGYPLYSTFFNYAKYAFGIVPLALILSHYYGAKGIIIGQALGATPVAIFAFFICRHILKNIENDTHKPRPLRNILQKIPLWPSSSPRTTQL